MGRKSNPTRPTHPPVEEPEHPNQGSVDACGDADAPDASGDLLGLNLSTFLSKVSSIPDSLGAANAHAGFGTAVAASPDGEGRGSESSSEVAIDVGVSGVESGKPLLSLDSDSDARISGPVFGPNSIFDIGGGDDCVVGDGGDGRALVSFGGDTDALVNAPMLGEDSGGGSIDVGGLLSAAMLDVGSIGDLDAIGDVYDGNVPLVGGLETALDSTLDLLTTTTSLFDVPVLDVLNTDGLDG
jgi:hypothetical protein